MWPKYLLTKAQPFVKIEVMDTMEHIMSLTRKGLSRIPNPCKGPNSQYSILDSAMSAFACFVAQDGSFNQFQIRKESELQCSNMKTIFGVNKIPKENQIRNLLDLIDPIYINDIYHDIFNHLHTTNMLEQFKILDNKFLVIALDGTQYFSSNNIHCDNCIVKKHSNGVTEYTHSLIATTLVSPNSNLAFLFPLELNVKDDTSKKQDCEQKAIFRLFKTNLIFLADDLHSHDQLVSLINNFDKKFILNCKKSSHKKLYEFVEYNQLNSISYLK